MLNASAAKLVWAGSQLGFWPAQGACLSTTSGCARQNLVSLGLTPSRSRLVDRGHYRRRGGLVHHVADASKAMERAWRDIVMQTRRLVIDFNQPVMVARDNDQRHFQAGIVASHRERVGIISADSAAVARICDGRSAISFGKRSNFRGVDAGPKSCAAREATSSGRGSGQACSASRRQ